MSAICVEMPKWTIKVASLNKCYFIKLHTFREKLRTWGMRSVSSVWVKEDGWRLSRGSIQESAVMLQNEDCISHEHHHPLWWKCSSYKAYISHGCKQTEHRTFQLNSSRLFFCRCREMTFKVNYNRTVNIYVSKDALVLRHLSEPLCHVLPFCLPINVWTT